ncbi:GntR family transcriptional regulator, histidine utilization repressor [Tistlia consotensis]|uniref:Histidine utilization repressor n=1 Tax=Tistlia consotensis USBA 355 TaxID=560819 RepID=A0A1Y6C8D6_9PROT|nr:histidine utilization repressor [Tistlia consotensis]SMF41858.1 GntR family transcriptional regulator, histidine utilization repressor [Tistlia consotensis USBA 355]SNR73304.1 GntR family transcriptional regulator, histidine utilization repressor [Tistlia consotensis]
MPRAPRDRTQHERILRDLKDRIVSGAWPPGFQLPFELKLAEDYGVSRMTMNKVLSQLTREGFLVRRRKLGTFVATPQAQSAVLEITDIESEVRALGLDYGFALHERAIRPPSESERREAGIAAAEPGEVLFLRGVHFAGRAPFCLETRIISLEAAPDAREQDFSREAPGRWLLERIPWTSAEHRIRAVNAVGATAKLLGLDPGEACLEVLRRTEIAGQWVTLVRQSYPGSKHQLLAQFTPRADAG